MKSLCSTILLFSVLISDGFGQRAIPLVYEGVFQESSTGAYYNKIIEFQDELIVGLYAAMPDAILIWTGSGFVPFPGTDQFGQTTRIYDMTVFDNKLVVAGKMDAFNNIAFYENNQWNPMGTGLTGGNPRCLQVYNGELYAGGNFTQSGSNDIKYIAKWSGSQWVQVGQGVSETTNPSQTVSALALHNNKLYAGGSFLPNPDTQSASPYLAAWNGSTWESVEFPEMNGVADLHNHIGKLYILASFGGNNGVKKVLKHLVDQTVLLTEATLPSTMNKLTMAENRVIASRIPVCETGYVLNSNLDTWRPMQGITVSDYVYFQGENLYTGCAKNTPYMEDIIFQIDWNSSYGGTMNSGVIENQIFPSGTFFYNPILHIPSYTFVQTETKPRGIYAAVPWLYVNDEALSITRQSFSQSDSTGWYFGPITSTYDKGFMVKYMRTWTLTKAEVDNHAISFNQPGYVIPEAILNWPGNGRINEGEAAHLAPFYDINQNGWYEPHLGDYPLMYGDRMLFFILHDPDTGSENQGPGVNLLVTFYQFDSGTSAHVQATFLNLKIQNVSGVDYNEMKLGLWSDIDIGNSVDDYVGCSPEANMYWMHNDPFDEAGSTSPGFGANPPALGLLFLSDTLTNFMYHNTNSSSNGNPNQDIHFYNYMNSMLTDGQPITYLSNEVQFMFDGNPWEGPEGGWIDAGVNPPGDRRGVGSIAPFSLANGQERCVDMVYLHAYKQQDILYQEVQELENLAIGLRAEWQLQPLPCRPSVFPLGISESGSSNAAISVFPNPSNGLFRFVNLPPGGCTFEVFTAQGSVVFQEKLTSTGHSLDMGSYPAGLYIAVVRTSEGARQSMRLIKH